MPFSYMQWRIEIESFNATSEARYLKKKSLWVAAPVFVSSVLDFLFLYY